MSVEQSNMALTVRQRAAIALNSQEHEKELTKLAAASLSIVKITNPAGRDQCHSALMSLRTMRTTIEKTGKAGRDEATQFSKAVIAEENRLIAIISPEETRLAAVREEWDAAIERERQAKIDAEIQRVQLIQERLAEIRGAPAACAASHSDIILGHIGDIEAKIIDSSFGEFEQEASKAKAATLASLRGLHAAAVARELDEQRIAKELAELAVLRAAQADRDRADKAKRDEEERIAEVERKAYADRIENDRRAEREAFEKEQRETRERQAAEDRRIADDRAELAREQEVLRVANLPKPAAQARRKDPSSEQIIDAVAEAFMVDARTALRYITSIDWDVVHA